MLNALIIDDEQPSREELKALLADAPDIEVIGECSNAIEGLTAIHRLRPDVVFLDIQMPRVSGLEMVGMIEPSAWFNEGHACFFETAEVDGKGHVDLPENARVRLLLGFDQLQPGLDGR